MKFLTVNDRPLRCPGEDKVARLYAVQPIFSNGIVFAPDKDWAEKVITQAENFPKTKHDDLVDSTSQALRYLRERNLLRRPEEIVETIRSEATWTPQNSKAFDISGNIEPV